MAEGTDISSNLSGRMGIFLLMITVTVLFGALSLGFFWTPARGSFEIPGLFYPNTLLLIFSSVLLHIGWGKRDLAVGNRLLTLALIAGATFLVGQGVAYWQLANEGMWIQESGRKMQYLYVLSGLHAVHLIGGLIFLSVGVNRNSQKRERIGELALYFWHFLGVLWLYLLIVMVIG